MTDRRVKHGLRGTPEYNLWKGVKARCLNPNDNSYKNYGGRGITIHPEWAQNFLSFLEGIGQRPHPTATIERKDNRLGYVPGNVVWATRKQQNRNRRSNKVVEFKGQTMCLAELQEVTGASAKAIGQRLRRGMALEKAIAFQRPQTQITAFGRTLTISDWAKERGLRKGTIRERILRGDCPERALRIL